ncbi:hypothetical protein R6Q59_024694 [Mikania micrantha]|uniref:Uncharacterized protein n=1 Tax=Mikania micrantha TaxID=192012 RepID=A0A5N6LB66_9ASTR|nr:hypothetical protein E3N88_44715 [Mikania micrantha]
MLMAINDLVRDAESTQYFTDQSFLPDSTFEQNIPSFIFRDDTYLREEHFQNEIDGHILGALKECLEEIDVKGKELFRQIVSDTHVEVSLGRLAREAIGEHRAKDLLGKIGTKVINKMKGDQNDEGFVVASRDLNNDDELAQKLERFKIKTVNIGGVVTQEEK